MCSKKEALSDQEVTVRAVQLGFGNIKEEIHAVFAGHMKTLASREQWLLNQADSIKDGIISVIAQKNLTAAETEAKLKNCRRFLEFCKREQFTEGAAYVSRDIMIVEEDRQDFPYNIPTVEFKHDCLSLHDIISNYGMLQTTMSDKDESLSGTSDRSWDLLDKEIDESEKTTDGINSMVQQLSSQPGQCCMGTTNCMQLNEIEDMDVGRLLASFDQRNMLKNRCKANELCNSVSECICDTPCVNLEEPYQDAVSCLKYKLSEIHGQISSGEKYAETKLDEPVNALRKQLQGIFESRPSNGFTSVPELTESNNEDMKEKDTVSIVASQIQDILGNSDTAEDSILLSWDSKVDDRVFDDFTVMSLSDKPDVVCDIAAKLQSILDETNVKYDIYEKQTSLCCSPPEKGQMESSSVSTSDFSLEKSRFQGRDEVVKLKMAMTGIFTANDAPLVPI